MRRLLIAAAVGATVVSTAVPSLAQSSAPRQSVPTAPIGVTYSTDGGVFVGVTIDGRPGVGGSVAGGKACVGVSLEVPFCAAVPPATITVPHPLTAQDSPAVAPPVTIYHDSTRTAVGVRDIGVIVYNNGTICPVVSTQDWQCVRVQVG